MKKFISIIILLFSVLIVFNLCFFLCLDYDGNTQAWICYLFFHLAYVLCLIGYLFTTRRRFAVLNSRLNAISLIYCLTTIITCLIFLSENNYSKEIEIFVFLIEILLYLVLFHYCYLTNRKAENGIIKDLKDSTKHEGWLVELRLLVKTTEDEEKVKIINSIIDEIRSCPSLSNPYVCEVDNEIRSLIMGLKSNYVEMQISELLNYKKEICVAVNKRTETLKSYYHKI